MNSTKKFQSITFFVMLIAVLILVARLFLPYASVLMWAAILYILISPLYTKILARLDHEKKFFNFKRRLLAGVFAIGTVLVLAGVIFFVSFNLYAQGIKLAETIMTLMSSYTNTFELGVVDTLSNEIKTLTNGVIDLSQINLENSVAQFLTSISNSALAYAHRFVVNFGHFLLSLIFLSFALYFFYVDGDNLFSIFVRAIPIDTHNTKRLLSQFKEVTTNLFQGLFLVSFYQTVISFILFSLFGVESPLLLAILIFFSSFLPLIGCSAVWFPVGIGLILSTSWIRGLLFLLIAGTGISFMDNFLRPFFLKDRIHIHPLLIFFSMLGGVNMLGFNGLVLGPMIVILFFTIIDIALEREKSEEDPLPTLSD